MSERSDRNGIVVNITDRTVTVNEPTKLSFEFMQAIIDGTLWDDFK